MKLLLATNNAHKAHEIREILKDSFSEIMTMREAGIELDVTEDGQTFLVKIDGNNDCEKMRIAFDGADVSVYSTRIDMKLC